MQKNDYVQVIYIIGIIMILATIVQGFFFYIFQLDKNPMYASMVSGQFYATGLFQIAGLMMVLYAAGKRFIEGWKSVKIQEQDK